MKLLCALILLFSSASVQGVPAEEDKFYTPKGAEPENDYKNDYDMLEDDNGDNEEDN